MSKKNGSVEKTQSDRQNALKILQKDREHRAEEFMKEYSKLKQKYKCELTPKVILTHQGIDFEHVVIVGD